jgi:hypothetical protein
MGIALTVQISLGAASILAPGLFQVVHPLVKDSESDGAGYGLERGDEAIVPLMVDVQDGIPDGSLGVIDLPFHVDASFREHPVYGQQHSRNVPVNVHQPVILGGALELAMGQIHAEPGVAAL